MMEIVTVSETNSALPQLTNPRRLQCMSDTAVTPNVEVKL
jgi:hypothetical protein